MSAPRRTTTVAPGITPCSTASLKACSTSLHPNAQHLRQRQLPRNCRLSKNDSARGGIDPRLHPERNRKILGTMPRLDAVQHRAPKTCSLLGRETRDHPALLLVAVDCANRTEHYSRNSSERARLPQLDEHPVDSIRLLARVFEEQNPAVEARLERGAGRLQPDPPE